jgi:hypothetical protein
MVALPLPRMYGGNPLQSISQSGAAPPNLVLTALCLYMCITGRYDGGFYLVQP